MTKNTHWFKLYRIILCILIVLCILIGIFTFHYIFQTKTKNKNMIYTYFDTNYKESEAKIDMYQHISEFLFESASVKNYAENNPFNQSYNNILVKKDISIYSKILANLGITCAITDLNESCITISGIMPLKQYRDEYGIPNTLIEKSKNENKECMMYMSASSYFFVFKHRYPSGSTIYSLITADKYHFIPASEDKGFVFGTPEMISKKYKIPQAKLENNDKKLFRSKLLVRSSILIPNAVYTYNPPDDITSAVFVFTFILLVGAIFVCRKLARYISNIIYMPIIKIVDIFGQSEHGDEFEFLDANIKSLIQNNQVLVSKLSESEANIRNGFIIDLLYNIVSDTFASKYIDDYNLLYLDKSCLCIVFECDYNELAENINEYTHTHIIQNNYCETLKKVLTNGQSGEFVILDNSRFAFIMPEISKVPLKNKLISVLELSENFYKIHPFIAIGRPVSNIKEIHTSFNDACEILTQRFDYMEKSILFFDELRANSTTFYYPLEFENKLIENTLYGEQETVSRMLSELIDANLYELSLNKVNLTEFKFAITATIKRITKMMGKTACDIFGENNIIYLNISHASTSDELKKNITDIFSRLFEYKHENTTQKQRKLSSDILKYIEDNYTRDISLTDISENFSISPGHISRILKNDVGIRFKELLDNIRITESKKLLTATNMTVNRIAEKIGYNNVQTFNRLFKRHTGFSPKEYREKVH